MILIEFPHIIDIAASFLRFPKLSLIWTLFLILPTIEEGINFVQLSLEFCLSKLTKW